MGESKQNEPFLDENCKPMTLTAQTKFGLTFGQIITLVTYTSLVVWMYANMSWRVSNVEKKQEEFKATIESQAAINTKLIETIDRIDRSVIRIEGKLDLKADKNFTR